MLESNADVRAYLLARAGVAVAPIKAFGTTDETGWCRLSCGAVSMQDIADALPRLRGALTALEA